MTQHVAPIPDQDARQLWGVSAPAPAAAEVIARANGVGKTFRGRSGEVSALSGIDLTIDRGAFVAILGRSGCGKSTLLRILAGLIEATSGSVWVDGGELEGPPPSVRYVFQDFGNSLFPWRNVIGNVRFGADNGQGRPKSRTESNKRAMEGLEMVGLAHVADRYPWELSGGMQQRVAIARAIASRPSVLLMDEPFGAVDALSRGSLQTAILELWHRLDLTILLVTHDIDEAIFLSQRVIVLKPEGSGIAADVPIDLPWPRKSIETRELDTYHRLRRELTAHVLGEG